MSEEQWREAIAGRVLVSSHGRVKLIGGEIRNKAHPRTGTVFKQGKGTYYYKISVKALGGGKTKFYSVHRLVCEAFNGPEPFDGAVVMHLDEDGLNNRPENLQWGTQKENLNMPRIKAFHCSRTGDNNPRRIAARKKAALNNAPC